jgi:hypothetical protein
MTLIELKNFITSGIVPTDFLILVNKDNQFLAKQYINALGELAPGGLNKISSIYEPFQSSLNLLTAPEGCINVLTVDTFDERSEDYSQFENTIVICEQVDKSISKVVENYIINLPKLEEWQIFDYAKSICPIIDDGDLTWLIKATNNNIERVINELDKVSLFNKNEQKAIFSSIRFDPQTDLYKTDLFTIVNALVAGDMPVLFEFLKHDIQDEIEPVVLVNRTFTSLKNILLISQNPALTAEDCGVSAGQYNYIKRNYFSLNIEAVKQKLKFLVNFDLALKTSQLDMSKRDMLTYIINNLAYKIRN